MFHFYTGVLTRKISNIEARQCALQRAFHDLRDELRLQGAPSASCFQLPKIMNEEDYNNFLERIKQPDERQQIVRFPLKIF